MTHDPRSGSDRWERLSALWERVYLLPPAELDAVLSSANVDDELRNELMSLLARTATAEDFFGKLQRVVVEARPADLPMESHTDDKALASVTDHRIGTVAGHYRIEERLGQGGMGVVYRATDLRLQRTVALKLLHTHTDDPRAKARLFAEARAIAALDHVNICTVYEVGETPEQWAFIAMAFYHGETLQQRLRRGPLPIPLAIDYVTQIASGLGAAHQRGIVHRDVKPANIIVTADGVLKLLDFGIARHEGRDASQDGITPGTIAYMSPEQVTSRAVDERSDLWSLGVVLYEMCTGVRPFGGEQAGAILYAIVHEDALPLSAHRVDVPAGLTAIMSKLLAKSPESRYANADALITDLGAGVPAVSTHPPRTRRPLRVVLSVAALLAVAIAVFSWTRRDDPSLSEARVAAQDLYDQGHRDVLFRTERGRQEALVFFRQAIAVDSTFATAHAGLAHLLVLISDNAGAARREQLQLAEKSARTAIRLDSLHADAHASLGHVLFADYQFAAAETEFKRAVALDPETPYVREFLVWLYIFMDRPRDALVAAERVAADNPTSPTALAEHARALMVNGRCSDASPILKKLMVLKPPPARVGSIAAQCFAQAGMWSEAVDAVRPVAEQSPLQGNPWLSFMLARSGDTLGARVLRDTLLDQWRRGEGGAYGVALAYAGARDFDEAVVWLGKAIDDRSLRYNIMEPVFGDLRRSPRFDRVRRRLGLAR